MADKQLTAKQKLFVEYYLLHMNGVKAAELAGYKGDYRTLGVTAHDNLRKPKIHAAIEAALAERFMGKNEILARLAEHGRASIGDFANVDNAQELADHPNARLVKKFKRTITTTGQGDKAYREERLEFELHDSQAAMVHLGRYEKLWTDKQELTGKDGGGIEINFRLIGEAPPTNDDG